MEYLFPYPVDFIRRAFMELHAGLLNFRSVELLPVSRTLKDDERIVSVEAQRSSLKYGTPSAAGAAMTRRKPGRSNAGMIMNRIVPR